MIDLLAPNMPFHSRERTEQRLRDEIERLRAEVATLRDQLATERDGLREQHGRDSAELCRLCERDKLRQQLAALREQIEKSPVAEPDGGWIDVAVPDSWNGNRVRLVREDDT
jgi:hypothetical protein